MALFENFPYTDMHNLNLDWIIKIAKDFLDQYTHIQQLISDGEQSLTDLTESGLSQLQDKYDTLENLLQEWYNTHSEDIAGQLADALADLNAWYTTHQNYLDNTLATNIAAFNAAAEQKAAETIATIPDDYTQVTKDVNAFKYLSELSIVYPASPNGNIDIDGSLDPANAFYTTDFIRASDRIVAIGKIGNVSSGYYYVNAYDRYYNFISGIIEGAPGSLNLVNPTLYNLPDKTYYIRVTCDGIGDHNSNFKIYSVDKEPEHALFPVTTSNIWNKKSVVVDKYVKPADGTYDTNASYNASGLVPIVAGKKYTVSNMDQLAFYNSSKQYIGGLNYFNGWYTFGSITNIDSWGLCEKFGGPFTFTAQSNFAYINVSIADKYLPNFMIWEGEGFPGYYEQYGIKIPDLFIDDLDVSSVLSFIVKQPINIKFLGDSITAGVGGTGYDATASGGGYPLSGGDYTNVSGHCWANSIKAYWESKFPCTVYNYGWSGRAAYQIVDRWTTLVKPSDNILIVMIGTNDRADASVADFITYLEGIVEKARSEGKYIIFMSPPPTSVASEETAIFNLHMEDIDHAFRYVTKKHKVPFLNVYELFMSYCEYTGITIDSLLGDGIHPNDAGYDVMFKLISNGFGITVKRPGATW